MDVLTQFLDDLYKRKSSNRFFVPHATKIVKQFGYSSMEELEKKLQVELPKLPFRPIIISSDCIQSIANASLSAISKNRIPFKTCFFVFENLFMNTAGLNPATEDSIVLIRYLFLYEVSPECYFYKLRYTTSTDSGVEHGFINCKDILDYTCNNQNETMMSCILTEDQKVFLVVLQVLEQAKRDNYKLLEYNSQHKVQYRNFARKLTGKIVYTNECLYIGKKKSLENSKFKDFKIINKPQFASEVMGHWRRLPERCVIGHDREGKEILDWTWVRPYIKGEGDLKVKSRIIQS